ncbi:hypothetical protein ABMD26_003628 [Pseudomonas sp. PvP001]
MTKQRRTFFADSKSETASFVRNQGCILPLPIDLKPFRSSIAAECR